MRRAKLSDEMKAAKAFAKRFAAYRPLKAQVTEQFNNEPHVLVEAPTDRFLFKVNGSSVIYAQESEDFRFRQMYSFPYVLELMGLGSPHPLSR